MIDRIQLGQFGVSVGVLEPPFLERQLPPGVMNPKQLRVPVERGRDFEGYLKMVSGLLPLTLAMIYLPKNTMRSADQILMALLRDEVDRAGCGFLCRVELLVRVQCPSEAIQTLCLCHSVTELFKDFRCFLRQFYPFLVKAR